MPQVTVIPGGSAVMRVQIRKYDGSLAVLDGATVSTTIAASETTDEAADQVLAPDSVTRLIVISGGQTAARAGRQIRVRVLIEPADGFETVGSEGLINVER